MQHKKRITSQLIPLAVAVTGLVLLLACVWLFHEKLNGRGLASYVPLHTWLETCSIVASVLVFSERITGGLAIGNCRTQTSRN